MQERECPVPCLKESVPLPLPEAQATEWSDCMGIPCQMGKQQRIRQCLQPSECDNEAKLFCSLFRIIINRHHTYHRNLKVSIQIGLIGPLVAHRIVYQHAHVNAYENLVCDYLIEKSFMRMFK